MEMIEALELWRRWQGAAMAMFCMATLVLTYAVMMQFTSVVQAAAVNGDADRGKALFEKRCTGCHSLDQDKEGPRLRHVYGSKAGSVGTFKYSSAISGAHISWDQSSLDKWLADPESIAPDNDMSFRLPKADERADIIRYLQVISEK